MGNKELWLKVDRVKKEYESLAGYLDELDALGKYPDIFQTNPRIFHRALERVFQLIVDMVINLSIDYVIDDSLIDNIHYGDYLPSKRSIVEGLSGVMEAENIDKFSGKDKYVERRNLWVHEEATCDEMVKLEGEITDLHLAAKKYMDELGVVAPCPYCGVFINFKDIKDISLDKDGCICLRCKNKYVIFHIKPILLRRTTESILSDAWNYANGENDFPQNFYKAKYFFKQAADLDSGEACYILGIDQYGLDDETRIFYLLKGAKLGYYSCWAQLALLCENKLSIETKEYWKNFFSCENFGTDEFDFSYAVAFIVEYISVDVNFIHENIPYLIRHSKSIIDYCTERMRKITSYENYNRKIYQNYKDALDLIKRLLC